MTDKLPPRGKVHPEFSTRWSFPNLETMTPQWLSSPGWRRLWGHRSRWHGEGAIHGSLLHRRRAWDGKGHL